MTNLEFIEQIYEIAFGDNALLRGFTPEEVIEKIRGYSDRALSVEEGGEEEDTEPTRDFIDELFDIFSDVDYFDGVHSLGNTDGISFEDDGFLHIAFGKYRITFYNGQEKGMLTEKQIPKYQKIVDRRMKNFK